VKFRKGVKLDPGQIDDLRGRGGGGGGFGRGRGGMGGGMGGGGLGGLPVGGKGLGGGAALVMVILVVAVTMCQGGGGSGLESLGGLAGNPVGLGASAGDETVDAQLAEQCGVDPNVSRECRVFATVMSVNEYWTDYYASQGQQYERGVTNFFTGQVNTACGPGSEQMGPFYCPGDREVYIPLDFFDLLSSQLGAEGGAFAEAYVVAHEYAHHVQTLNGQMQRVGNDRQGADSALVRLELQADCLAGVWAGNAERDGFVEDITDDDIRRGIDAAEAVGDDRIQERMQGEANPDSFTHGTSEQRRDWFVRGLRSADPAACDTFSVPGDQL
jgi:uncharacterized protein